MANGSKGERVDVPDMESLLAALAPVFDGKATMEDVAADVFNCALARRLRGEID